jgi:hypothetical protein
MNIPISIDLTKGEQEVIIQSLKSVIKAGDARGFKPNTTDFKVLEVNKDILGQILHLQDLSGGKYNILPTVTAKFNRREMKVLAATMIITAQLQANALKEYETRPEDHKSFSDQDGRRKSDYVTRLQTRMDEVNSILTKVRKTYE